MKTHFFKISFFLFAIIVASSFSAVADDNSDAEIAKKLSNPIADLISVPFQNNWDSSYGPKDSYRYTLNVQPVIPFELSDDLNLITRTIVPIIYAESPADGVDSETGLGDITQSFFFSPKTDNPNDWVWGVGPAMLYATDNGELLGGSKWGAGPTGVFLKQEDGFTYGLLTNHIWSYAGSSQRSEVNSTFLQPFFAYTTAQHTTYTLNTESTYDWQDREWNIPINFVVSQLIRIDCLPVSIGLGPRYYAESPDGGPEWGARLVVQLIFPK